MKQNKDPQNPQEPNLIISKLLRVWEGILPMQNDIVIIPYLREVLHWLIAYIFIKDS